MLKRITITRAENGCIVECEHQEENGGYVEPTKYVLDDDIETLKGKFIEEEEGEKKKSFPMNRLKSY